MPSPTVHALAHTHLVHDVAATAAAAAAAAAICLAIRSWLLELLWVERLDACDQGRTPEVST